MIQFCLNSNKIEPLAEMKKRFVGPPSQARGQKNDSNGWKHLHF